MSKEEKENLKRLLESDSYENQSIGLSIAKSILGWDNLKALDWMARKAISKTCGTELKTFEDFCKL